MNVILPIGIGFKEWADQLNEDLTMYVVPLADSVNTWQDWANQFISINELWAVPLATSVVFPKPEDWRRWARYFVETIYLI